MERPVTSKPRGICRYYNTSRGCFAGDNCKFKHGEHEELTPYDKSKVCRYFAAGYCKRGEKCWFKHVTNPPIEPSESLICAICMEEPITFGLLVDCSHVFCIDCIRNWRGQESMADDISFSYVHKKCPYCRTPSKFVIPSSHFYPSGHPGKAAIIEQYKASLQRIPCRYFIMSNPDHRYCPFGRDCMYQHLNEDGTPYVFTRGVDYYMPQRDRHLRGFLREVMTRSVFEHNYNPWIDSPDSSEEELPGELAFDQEAGLDLVNAGLDNATYLTLARLITAQNPNLDTPTPGLADIPTMISLPPPSIISFSPEPPPVPESNHTLTSPNVQPSDPALHSTPSSPASSMPPLEDASDLETEPDLPDVTNTSALSDMSQDRPPSQPINEPATSSDVMPRRQSLPNTLLSSVMFPQRAACLDTGTPAPTSPVLSQMDMVESQSLPSSQVPESEVSSMIEVGATASTQSPTRDPPAGEVTEMRQQEPPFMTDGRGRVVWSRSGVKRSSSPFASRNHDRTANTAGDRD